jgi:hypothetical protein
MEKNPNKQVMRNLNNSYITKTPLGQLSNEYFREDHHKKGRFQYFLTKSKDYT